MTEEQLFDIEYWLPFNGGEYHCTIAVGVTQSYVDRVKIKYEIDLKNWQDAPSAWKMPFFHIMKVIPHKFMPRDYSFVHVKKHNKDVEKAKEEGKDEGMKQMAHNITYYISNQQKLAEFKKNYNRYFND
jgi:hypothetical protein